MPFTGSLYPGQDDANPMSFEDPDTTSLIDMPFAGSLYPGQDNANPIGFEDGNTFRDGLESDGEEDEAPQEADADERSHLRDMEYAEVLYQSFKAPAYALVIKHVYPFIDVLSTLATTLENLKANSGTFFTLLSPQNLILSRHSGTHTETFPNFKSATLVQIFRRKVSKFISTTRTNIYCALIKNCLMESSKGPNCGFKAGSGEAVEKFNRELAEQFSNQTLLLDKVEEVSCLSQYDVEI